METTDRQFILTFLAVSGALVLIAVVVLVAANLIGAATADNGEISDAQVKIMADRIEPVGKLNTGDEAVQLAQSEPAGAAAPKSAPAQAQAETAAPAKAAAAADKPDGKTVYNGICKACHDTGAAGAPVVGNIEQWQSRTDQGIETLYKNAINGLGAMPPKGGNPSLSDAETKAAVDYMIEHSTP